MSTTSTMRESPPTGRALIRRVIDFARTQNYEAGDRFPAERLFAERLGVGRNALREALATLESLRVVELRPNSGVYLRALASEASFEAIVLLSELGATPSADEVRETIEVRAPLERQAINLACTRRTDVDLASLDRILADTDRIVAAGGNIVECDQAIHLALAGASHNSVLVRMLNAFYCLTLARRRVFFADPRRASASAKSHRAIVAALRRRDAVRAGQLMDKHMGNAQHYWKEALDDGAAHA